MDRAKLQLDELESDPRDSASVAETVNRDFGELVAIFSRHLEVAQYADCKDRSAVMDARAAAEHGLRLSRQLVDLLRTSTPRA
jgi:hypothetical protein